jgi:hypothetical protein
VSVDEGKRRDRERNELDDGANLNPDENVEWVNERVEGKEIDGEHAQQDPWSVQPTLWIDEKKNSLDYHRNPLSMDENADCFLEMVELVSHPLLTKGLEEEAARFGTMMRNCSFLRKYVQSGRKDDSYHIGLLQIHRHVLGVEKDTFRILGYGPGGVSHTAILARGPKEIEKEEHLV